MERLQVADGGMASNMDGNCEYIEKAVAVSRKGVVLQLGVGRGADKLLTEKLDWIRNVYLCLRPGLILWYDLGNGKGT